MTCLNPPNPLFKGAHQGLRAFHRHSGFPCPPTPARHLMTCLNPPNPMFFIGTLSQTLTLRAAFASSTYLLSQIPGPGRSSDDDLLNPLRFMLILNPPFQGGDQGLRAFHRRNGFPCPPASARHLMMPANPSGVRAKELRSFLLPYTPGVQRDDTRGAARKLQIINYLTKIRVVVFATLKIPKSLIASRIRVARPVSS